MVSLLILFAIIAVVAIVASFVAPPSWRTIAVNGTLGLIAVLAEIVSGLDGFNWRSILPENAAGWVIFAITVINILGRLWTTSPAMLPKGERPPRRPGQ